MKRFIILDHQARMFAELFELQQRINKLSAFITSNDENIDTADLRMMQMQLRYMQSYENVLNVRVQKYLVEVL